MTRTPFSVNSTTAFPTLALDLAFHYALIRVFCREFVAVLAHLNANYWASSLSLTILKIVHVCAEPQMGRIDARRDIAFMENQ